MAKTKLKADLMKAIADILEIWSVIRAIECEFNKCEIDQMIQIICEEIEDIVSKKQDSTILMLDLAEMIREVLEENNIDVEYISCQNISKSIIMIIDEYYQNKSETYQNIVSKKPLH